MLFWVIIISAYVVGVLFVLAICNASKRGTADLPGLKGEVQFENLEQELRAIDQTFHTDTAERQEREKVAEPMV